MSNMPLPLSTFRMPLGYGVDDPDEHLLSKMLVHMNASGHRLLHIGDSMITSQLVAFFCELKREDDRIMIHPKDYTQIRQSYATHFKVTIPPGIMAHVLFIPDIKPQTSSTFTMYNTALKKFNTPTSNTIAVMNIGLHMSGPLISKTLVNLLNWTNHHILNTVGNVAVYREVPAQHFPFQRSGRYLEKMKVDYLARLEKNHSVEHLSKKQVISKYFSCVSVPYVARYDDVLWRTQRQILERYQYKHIQLNGTLNPEYSQANANNKHIVAFTDATREMHDIHIVGGTDCTHYCGAQPVIWQTVWHQLYHIVLSTT